VLLCANDDYFRMFCSYDSETDIHVKSVKVVILP